MPAPAGAAPALPPAPATPAAPQPPLAPPTSSPMSMPCPCLPPPQRHHRLTTTALTGLPPLQATTTHLLCRPKGPRARLGQLHLKALLCRHRSIHLHQPPPHRRSHLASLWIVSEARRPGVRIGSCNAMSGAQTSKRRIATIPCICFLWRVFRVISVFVMCVTSAAVAISPGQHDLVNPSSWCDIRRYEQWVRAK